MNILGSWIPWLKHPDTVTYFDNTKEDTAFDVLPYPVFVGMKCVA